MKKNLLFTMFCLASFLAMPNAQAMSALRRMPSSLSRSTLASASAMVRPNLAQSRVLPKAAFRSFTQKVQPQKNSFNKRAVLATTAATGIVLGASLIKKTYAHENDSFTAQLKYNEQTGKHEYSGRCNKEDFFYTEMAIPEEWLGELRAALVQANIDPNSVSIIGFDSLYKNSAMTATQWPNGLKVLAVNVPLFTSQSAYNDIYADLQRIFSGHHEVAHFQKHLSLLCIKALDKSEEQIEVEADIGALVAMVKDPKTKEIVSKNNAYSFLNLAQITRSAPYLSSSEQIFYGSAILNNPPVNEQEEQKLVEQVLQNRALPDYQQKLHDAVSQLAHQGGIQVSPEILDNVLYRAKANSINSTIKSTMKGFIFGMLLSGASTTMPVVAVSLMTIPIFAARSYYSKKSNIQHNYNLAVKNIKPQAEMGLSKQ